MSNIQIPARLITAFQELARKEIAQLPDVRKGFVDAVNGDSTVDVLWGDDTLVGVTPAIIPNVPVVDGLNPSPGDPIWLLLRPGGDSIAIATTSRFVAGEPSSSVAGPPGADGALNALPNALADAAGDIPVATANDVWGKLADSASTIVGTKASGTTTRLSPSDARTVLGLGTSATHADTEYVHTSGGGINGILKTGDGGTTNYTEFDADGHQIMHGLARPWKDHLVDALAIKTQGTGVSINYTDLTVEFTHNAGVNDFMFANVQFNHDRDETSDVSPHIHWFAAEQTVVPNFVISYRYQKLGSTKVTSWTNAKCNTMVTTAPAAGVTAHALCEGPDITPLAGSGISDILQIKIWRDHSNTSGLFTGDDPYTGAVGVLAFDVHYQLNSLGSKTEYSK